MSWILNPEGVRSGPRNSSAAAQDASANTKEPPVSPWSESPLTDDHPKVPDPAERDRMVSTKQANRPFLAYSEYRAKKEKEHSDWLERKKERDEKISRGEEVGPEEPDPTEEPEVGCLGLLKFILYFTIFVLLAGKFFTGSFLWEQQLPSLRQFLPSNDRLFSEQQLALFDGTDPDKPIYLAIDGVVYDVTAGRATYGPGGSYHRMAGKDAARAYGTGCFATHQTHDLRGLSDREMKGVEHWKKFYADSNKYHRVGRVSHPPIDPMTPIPKHCDPKRAKEIEEEAKVKANPSAKHSEDL